MKAVTKTVRKKKSLKHFRGVRQARAGISSTHTHSTKAYGGKKSVSPWELPKGGLKSSPAWKLLVARSGGSAKKLPPPQKRLGAPISGGFPVNRWPANVLVDVERAYWLPDDWGQGIKNTGTGGTYIGWIGPDGKFSYHRNIRGDFHDGVEAVLGKKLTALDGFNGLLRKVQSLVPPGADKKFLTSTLTASERKHVLPASKFHFCIISARRADTNDGQHNLMLVEAHFRSVGVQPTWYVDDASVAAYRALSLKVVSGGKLTPARNKALNDAARQKKICVQVSDDISLWEYFDIKQVRGHQDGFAKQNAAVAKADDEGRVFKMSPVGAAQFILAKMRSSRNGASFNPQLGGVLPQSNPAMGVGGEEFGYEHFILGDFFVVDSSSCRFDTSMTLKEDYDFTCSHLAKHGAVLRCNRMILRVKHATNTGGAVSERDAAGAKERQNIEILMRKWPGAFKPHGTRQNEVRLCWGGRK